MSLEKDDESWVLVNSVKKEDFTLGSWLRPSLWCATGKG